MPHLVNFQAQLLNLLEVLADHFALNTAPDFDLFLIAFLLTECLHFGQHPLVLLDLRLNLIPAFQLGVSLSHQCFQLVKFLLDP